ncbi:Bestrophin, RFP-TM, chloride channel [Bremerella volcania]|uniref:Bestrophin, RFP-TM, chloride channel n=1 Tax=Bremerella volcania TaxID=2527984 RepID=A0A518C8I8_9BACT|nr:bestrophin family protein [Bremerella volcania]QDU75546.1 Bestrophin, RFP-TM, chloride channel [Bremerella volcania]
MIVTDKESWLGMIFAVHGTTMESIWPRVAVVFFWSILITVIAYTFPEQAYTLTMAPFTVVGLALAIFLGFRNNASYDRYWEGRKLWGRMVNVCRSFTMQINTLVDDANSGDGTQTSGEVQQQRLHMVRLIICHIHALRHRLRDTDAATDLEEQLPGDAQLKHDLAQDNVPAAIADRISRQINSAWRKGRLDTYHVPLLHNCLTEMMGIQGGCERIKSTPIPYTYSVLTHRTVFIYCMALPCGLHDTVGPLTPLVVALVAYFFLGLDAVGDEIEQPFMTDDNDLPLLQLTTMIERNVLQLSGCPDEDLPEPIKPVDHLLI